MKKLIASLALVALTGAANAATNLVPNGNFVTPAGVNWSFAGVGAVQSFPASGGNPGGHGQIDQTAAGWGGVLVSETSGTAGHSLTSLGVTNGVLTTFTLDMKSLGAGTPLAGMKIEGWAGGAIVGNSGDITFPTTTSWANYAFNYTIPAAATSLKFVPLLVTRPIGSSVAFDNIGVVGASVSPLAVSITSPANGATVTTNFKINATATVLPGTVTNVAFFDGAALLGNDTTAPFSYSYVGAATNAHALKVVAKDSFGNSATSSVVNITVVLPIFTLVPNGDFEIPAGASWGFAGVGAGPSYPAAGGNPGGFGKIDQTAGGWGGVLVSETSGTAGHSLGSLGVTAGGTYTFSVDMISLGSSLPTSGMKIESWAGGAPLGNSGDVNFNITTNWATYTFDYTIHGSATSLKFVPLMVLDPIGAMTGFDNVGVIGTGVPAVIPLSAQITTPVNGALRPDYFDIKTSVAVSPGTVTNVAFYDGVTLLTGLQNPPFDLLGYGPFTVGSHPLKIVAKDSFGNSVTSAVVNVTVSTAVNVTVDIVPVVNGITNVWLGYMNVLESLANPTNSLGFVTGSVWATKDLRAIFCGSSLILSPNTIDDAGPYWYVSTNSPSVNNKTMNANFYVEPAGSLPGQLVTFSGTVNLNTLVGPLNPAGQGWTVKAFIKDFAPNYSAFTPAEVVVPASGNFSVQLQTSYVAENHVQYGFTVEGPCVWPTDSALAGYGKVQIAATSAVLPAATTVTPTLNGGNLRLSFPTEGCYAYTVQVKTNLTDANWSTLTVTNGTGGTAIVSTPTSGGGRFFRVSAQ